MMLKTVNGALVQMSAAEEAEARALIDAGVRLKRTARGVDILLNAQEEAALRADWADADARLAQATADAQADADVEAKRRAAIDALAEEQIKERARQPDAPQAIKDYADLPRVKGRAG